MKRLYLLISLLFLYKWSLSQQDTSKNNYYKGDFIIIPNIFEYQSFTSTSLIDFSIYDELFDNIIFEWDARMGDVELVLVDRIATITPRFLFPVNGVDNPYLKIKIMQFKICDAGEIYTFNEGKEFVPQYKWPRDSITSAMMTFSKMKYDTSYTTTDLEKISYQKSGEILRLTYLLFLSSLEKSSESYLMLREMSNVFPILSYGSLNEEYVLILQVLDYNNRIKNLMR